MNDYSFQRGWFQVRTCDVSRVRNLIMAAVGITTRTAFQRRLNGDTYGTPAEHQKIEAIFNDFGITEVWGLVD